MALSDSCSDFAETIISAAKELLAAVEWYADSPLDYGEETAALRNACLDVQRTPWNPEAAVKLIRLAATVQSYHDTVPGSPFEDKRREEMNRLIQLLIPALDQDDIAEVKAVQRC